MKKLFLLMAIAMMTIGVTNALEIKGKVYCELVGTQKFFSSQVTVDVDFGQARKAFVSQSLVDEKTGKKISFNSMVDAMNFMGALGWEFENAYAITMGSQNVYHWLLSKYITDDVNINDGFTTKQQFKEKQLSQEENQEGAEE